MRSFVTMTRMFDSLTTKRTGQFLMGTRLSSSLPSPKANVPTKASYTCSEINFAWPLHTEPLTYWMVTYRRRVKMKIMTARRLGRESAA